MADAPRIAQVLVLLARDFVDAEDGFERLADADKGNALDESLAQAPHQGLPRLGLGILRLLDKIQVQVGCERRPEAGECSESDEEPLLLADRRRRKRLLQAGEQVERVSRDAAIVGCRWIVHV